MCSSNNLIYLQNEPWPPTPGGQTRAVLLLRPQKCPVKCVWFYGNNSEGVTKVAQTKNKYDQCLTQYASRLLHPICMFYSGEHVWNRLKARETLSLVFF